MVQNFTTGDQSGKPVVGLSNGLSTSGNGWPPRPFQIVSLLEMVLFCAGDFAETIRQLCLMMDEARWFQSQYGGDAFLDIQCKERLPAIRAKLDGLMTVVSRHDLRRSMEEIEKSQWIAPDVNSTVTVSVYQDRLWHIWQAIHSDLYENLFLFVPQQEAGYYEGFRQPAYIIKHHVEAAPDDIELAFGQKVNDNFPGARHDINEAANCYATDRNTACVFHCMRVVEHGLRAMAKRLKVKLPKNLSVELAEWKGLIENIEKEISKIENLKRSKRRDEALEFYHGAASQFRHFKNAWRNHVMHSRQSYDHEDAERVIRHVREFMRHLAENGVKETTKRKRKT